MKFDKNLAAIHGYLCSDGYVIKNPVNQRHKYYYIGLRNTNLALLRDFQEKFETIFGKKPIITTEGRAKIQNKAIYEVLTKDFSYYSYEWKLPKLGKDNLRYWLRAFFDCEGWVENQPAKSRLIGADCCNETGLLSIQEALRKLGISSNIQKRSNRTIWRLTICGLDDLEKFQKSINFLHPEKKKKLEEAILSFKDFSWQIPRTREELFTFIQQKARIRKSRNELRVFSIQKDNLQNVKKALKEYDIHSKLFGPWKNNYGSLYYCLIIKEELNGKDGSVAKRDKTGG